MKTRIVIVAAMSLCLVMPAFGKTYKTTYPVSCSEVWTAVKATLGNPDNYNVVSSDDAKMNAVYDVKHSAHVDVSGALLQRKNHVTLVPQGTACEMQVVSNYSGWEHDDQGDLKKRVEEAMSKQKAAPATSTTGTPASASARTPVAAPATTPAVAPAATPVKPADTSK